jgi:hypothetical protein
MFDWSTAFNTSTLGVPGLDPASLAGLSSGFTGGAAAAGGAAAGAGGAAGGLLGVAGGPVGMAVQGLASVGGAIMANKAAEASMKNAMNRQWEAGTFNIAGDEYQKDRSYGRQLRAKMDEDKLRRAGVTAFDDFQNLLNTGVFTATGANRALSNPLFSRS